MKDTNLDLKPEHPLRADDYLDLWKYFEARADDLKGHMFESVTWIIGFAAAVLGFIFGKFVDLGGAALEVSEAWLAVGFCGVGLVLCAYAGLLLAEYADHIKRNWTRSERCRQHVTGLSELITDEPPVGLTPDLRIPVWWQVGVIVVLFALAFVATAVFILARCGCPPIR